ncbi:MAG: RagB/SusD family nutrient uptake outer membrane protein [Prevotella sp.]|nr:RagB/SusD family nutrient uptake outer membrane protein [Prevotella sp.]
MKKVILFGLSLPILLSVAMFTSCEKNDQSEDSTITVQDNGSLSQNVFADETQGKSGVTFTTTGAWMSSISETSAKKASAPAWISIDPDHGDKAGNYTISISLEPNYTGTERTAIIRIVCGDNEITVSITQKSVKEDGKTPVPSVNELGELYESYGELWEAWLQIDNGYSTYTSRLSLTHASPFLYEFWVKSYECISHSNLLIEQLENSNIPESDKASYRGKAFAFRATAYFYLKTLFGGVPLVSSTETLFNPIPRSTVQETLDFVYDDIDRANELSAQSFTAIFGLAREVIYMQENDGVDRAIDALRRKIDNGDSAFRDINGDGFINSADENTEAVLIHLLLAEACLKTGNTTEAAQYVNRINMAYGQAPALPSSASANDIQTVIRQKYSALTNAGMKYLNAVRWGDTASWGYRELLPIPLQAMQENPNLTQNSGW